MYVQISRAQILLHIGLIAQIAYLAVRGVHWHTAWVRTFQVIGDSESKRDLAIVLNEEA